MRERESEREEREREWVSKWVNVYVFKCFRLWMILRKYVSGMFVNYWYGIGEYYGIYL